MCEKVSYPTREEAIAAVCGLQERKGKLSKSKRQPSKTYYCIDCQGWHISTKKRRRFNKTFKRSIHGFKMLNDKPKEKNEILLIHNYTGKRAA
jgi:uncharacterized protein YlaI